MTKAADTKTRGKSAAHALYAAAIVALVLWMFLPGRAAAAAGVLMYLLPPVAFVVDIMSTPSKEDTQ